jgi:hypothetical protein
MLDDVVCVPVHEKAAAGDELVQLVERCGVIDETHVVDAQHGTQVVRDGRLEVLKAVLVRKAQNLEDEVVLEVSQLHLPRVDVAEEVLEGR